MNFTNYLQQKKYRSSTIDRYTEYSERFLNWLTDANIDAVTFTYNDLLSFMKYANQQGITKRTLHNILCVIRHYCNYLIHEGRRTGNPAAGVFIKGLVRKLPTGLIGMEELEELHKQYSMQISVNRSKKIMFGLMVCQGLTVGELTRLERRDIKLKEGKIKIKATGRTNERTLDLHAAQMVELQLYLSENKHEEKLFTGQWISNRVQHMFDQLKQLNPKVINAKQIRSSVIAGWLRKNNLRQVQYMAGHKFVSSTQRYQLDHLDDLKNELQQHHPMS